MEQIEDNKVTDLIDQGTYRRVYKAEKDGEYCAIK